MVGDADRMTQYGGVSVDVPGDVDASHKLDEFPSLRSLMRSLCIDRLAYQMDRHGTISHFRCAKILYRAEWSTPVSISRRRVP